MRSERWIKQLSPLVLALSFGFGPLLLLGCRSSAASAEASVAQEKPKVPVRVRPAVEGHLNREESFVGDIRAVAQVSVKPEMSGRVAEVLVDEGTFVRRGDPLVRLDETLLRLQVQQAQAAFDAARIRWEQSKALAKLRSEAQRAQAQAMFDVAQSAFERLEALAELQSKTQLEQAEAGLEALKLNLEKIRKGAREQERKQIAATVEQAKANLRNAEANFRRTEQLFKEGVVSEQNYEGVRTGYEVAQAQYEAAQQQLSLVEEGARPEDIAAMEAQVRQAEAALQLARQSNESRTWEKDLASARAQVRQAEASLKLAQAQLDAQSWQAEIDGAKATMLQMQAALQLAQEQLKKATILAPMDGVITKRYADPGALAAPTAPLLDMSAIDEVEAVVAVPEERMAQFVEGRSATITTTAYPDRHFKGRIARVGPDVDPMTRTAAVAIRLDNADHQLRPGMFARAIVSQETAVSHVLVPRVAVLREGDTAYVFTVDQQRAVKRLLQLGAGDERWYEVLEGLKPGEPVVVLGQQKLQDTMSVEVLE